MPSYLSSINQCGEMYCLLHCDWYHYYCSHQHLNLNATQTIYPLYSVSFLLPYYGLLSTFPIVANFWTTFSLLFSNSLWHFYCYYCYCCCCCCCCYYCYYCYCYSLNSLRYWSHLEHSVSHILERWPTLLLMHLVFLIWKRVYYYFD